MSADYDLRPQQPPIPQSIRKPPPPPAQPPTAGQRQQPGAGSQQQRGRQRRTTVNKTRTGGGFNPSINPSLSINMTKGGGGTAGQGPAQGGGGAAGGNGGATPGSAFMSNEDIHAFSEHVRKGARQRAAERAMDAEQLEQVLRHIPDASGSLVGARLRARRVSRHLKRIAKADQVAAKEAAALYASFEREYEADLRKVGRGRTQQPRTGFNFR